MPTTSERRRYVGIDPGSKGAIAIIDSWGNPLSICDLCSEPLAVFNSFRDDPHRSILNENGTVWMGAVELPAAVSKESTSSAQKLGISIGMSMMLLVANGIPVTFVSPQTWKRKVFYGTRYAKGPLDKRAARGLAEELMGGIARDLLGTRKDEGPSEAFLIARWLWLTHGATKPNR